MVSGWRAISSCQQEAHWLAAAAAAAVGAAARRACRAVRQLSHHPFTAGWRQACERLAAVAAGERGGEQTRRLERSQAV